MHVAVMRSTDQLVTSWSLKDNVSSVEASTVFCDTREAKIC